jgi:hypothetical protein
VQQGGNRVHLGIRSFRAILIALALTLAFAATAQAYYVDISITGAGRVYETTDANELDEHCTAYPEEGFSSPGTTPTGTVGATCRAGDASGDYGWGWTVRYVAEPAAGYTFDGWQSDGRTNPGSVVCDDSNTGNACQFATYANLQTRARFVDEASPSMSSLTGPNQVVNGPATFTFSAASDPTLSHFQCRVAGVHDWQTCSSGRQENPASSGSYTFQVRAVDRSGNTSAESTWDWDVDKVAPETTLTDGPSGTVGSTSATFEFNSNEQGGFTCTLDAVAVSCGSPKTYTNLGQGGHTFQVQARDVAGNTDPSPATRTWTVDTVAPNTTIGSGPAEGSTTTSTSASIVFSSEAGASFRCQLDSGPIDDDCSSPLEYTGLALGSHTVTVWARDAVGNEDATPATRTWTIIAPEGGDGDGDGDDGTGDGGGGGAGGGETELDIAGALADDVRYGAKKLKKLGLKKLLGKGRATMTANPLTAGQLVAKLKGQLAGAKKAQTIGKAKQTVDAPGQAKLKLKLSKKGEKLLEAVRKADAKLKGVLEFKFLADSGAAAKAQKKVTLKG